MKYKGIKEFGCAKKGDILTNSVEDPEVFTLEVEEDNTYRYMSISDDIADCYCEDEYLLAIDELSDAQVINNTLAFIDKLNKQYEEDYRTAEEKADKGEIPPAMFVEARTVYFNLTKVLNEVKKRLMNKDNE